MGLCKPYPQEKGGQAASILVNFFLPQKFFEQLFLAGREPGGGKESTPYDKL